MKHCILLSFILHSLFAFGQNPQIEWVKSLGGSDFDYPAKIVEMTDGGYLILGGTRSNDFDITQNRESRSKSNSSNRVTFQRQSDNRSKHLINFLYTTYLTFNLYILFSSY